MERIIVLLALAALALLPGYNPLATMPDEAWCVAVLAIVMATLWMTVALPLSITALLPLIILPLYDVQPLKDAATAYADPIIFLFLGAMILGGALEHQKLHRYLVVIATRIFGYRPETLVASIMGVTFFISMWINNTSTMAIILPLAVALVKESPRLWPRPEQQWCARHGESMKLNALPPKFAPLAARPNT